MSIFDISIYGAILFLAVLLFIVVRKIWYRISNRKTSAQPENDRRFTSYKDS